MHCKLTKKKITPIMSFGQMPIANGFIKKKNFKKEYFYEMEVGFNEKLSLFQLNKHPAPKNMFNQNYPFFSGSSQYMKLHFKKYADFLKKNYLKSNSKIIEIGSNDGTMLENFLNTSSDIYGFEPSKNVAKIAEKKGIPTFKEFFNLKTISNLKKNFHKIDLIYASNVICHIPDLDNLIRSIDILLSKDGAFIFEEPYIGSMFDKTSYDQIYDEHIYMFSISSIDKIFKLYDFELTYVEPQNTHGGSMRYVIKRKSKTNLHSKFLNKFLTFEKKKEIDTIKSSMKFKLNCEISKRQLIKKIEFIKSRDKKICGYGATSKSTTVLNYCGIGPDSIDYICDTTKEKIGKYSPGKHIPIVDMNFFYKNQPDYIYLFAWNHKEEIFKKESAFKGKWFSHVSL